MRFHVAAGAQHAEQRDGDSLNFVCSGGWGFSDWPYRLWIAHQFVQADRHSLAQVHGEVFFASRDAHQPVTVAEVFVREAALLRTEQKGDTARSELLADEASAVFQSSKRVLQFSVMYRRGSYHERAVGDGLGHTLVLFRARQQRRSADRGACLAKCRLVWIYHS